MQLLINVILINSIWSVFIRNFSTEQDPEKIPIKIGLQMA